VGFLRLNTGCVGLDIVDRAHRIDRHDRRGLVDCGLHGGGLVVCGVGGSGEADAAAAAEQGAWRALTAAVGAGLGRWFSSSSSNSNSSIGGGARRAALLAECCGFSNVVAAGAVPGGVSHILGPHVGMQGLVIDLFAGLVPSTC